MGQEGDETYPMAHPWGWWENEMLQVLFKCKALSLSETVDSRYLSVLDHMTVLDERDGVPQSWGADFVERQSNERSKDHARFGCVWKTGHPSESINEHQSFWRAISVEWGPR